MSRLPFQVEKIQTDYGAEFQSSVHWTCLTREWATSAFGRPHPGSREKWSARTGFTPKSSTDYSTVPSRTMPAWEDYYTYHRPHGGLGGQTRRTQARRVPPPSVTQLALDAAAVQLAQSGQPRAPSPPPTVHRRRRSPAGPVRISQDRGDALPVDPVEHQRRINYLQRDTPLVGNRARFAMSNAYARTAG
jgi:hypothetical protein